MRLPRIAIENHQFTIIMVILLLLFGITSFLTMPRSEDPQVSPAGSSIVVIYPGASPEDIEQQVVDPIEEAINELEDIKDLNSSIEDGLAVIAVEFFSGSDPDDKFSDVVQKVNRVRNDLPEAILSLDIEKWSIANVNILQLAMVSDSADYRILELQAERLENQLERVPGIKQVESRAYPEQEVRISLDLEKMAQLYIPLNQVIGAVKQENMIIPGGNIDVGEKRFNIKTSGAYATLEDIKRTIIHAREAKPVYLEDIARVELTYEDNTYFARFNNQQSIWITAQQKTGTNIFTVTDKAKEKIAAFEAGLPEGIRLHYVFDQSGSVANRLNVFFSNLFQGLLLVGAIVFLAFGFRASVIIAMVIPMSIIIAIGFVDLSGYGLEQMSIVAMVIALGLLVDNAIVVTENISRFLKNGFSRKEAAVKGVNQVGWAIVSSTATTILAFVPIIMMRDVTGDFIRSMPVTVVYTLAASLLLALTLTPYLASRFLKIEKGNGRSRLYKLLDYVIEKEYRKRLDYALRHRTRIMIISILSLFLAIFLFRFVGVSFFPKAEKTQFIINVRAPQGTSIDKTDQIASYVESILLEESTVDIVATNIGKGNPRLYYNVFALNEKSNVAQIFVDLGEEKMKEFYSLIGRLREEFDGYPGARIEVKEFEQGPPVTAPIDIRIFGENLDKLRDISRYVESVIAEEAGTVNVDNPLRTSATDLHININREKAGILGLSMSEIDRTIRAAIAGMTVSEYRDENGKEYDIVVRMPFEDKIRIHDLDKIYMTSVTGAQIPLKQVASIEFKKGPSLIHHYKLQRDISVRADVLPGYSVDNVTKSIMATLDRYDWPVGYRYSVGGELESREESFGGMFRAVIIALIAIFGVLVLQFKSFTQPLIVFSAIPMAIIGSVLALLITGYSFSFTAFVGITSLIGIVINNSIILVDFTNQLRGEGMHVFEALKKAGETRFIPIILTTATTVGGLLPLTLSGGSLWAPMGWTIIGGLMVSTFLTLLVVPVLYHFYTPKEAKVEK